MRIVWDHVSKVPCLGSFILSDPLLLLITLSFVLAPHSYDNSVQSKNGASKNVPRVCGAQGNNTDCPCSHHVYGDVSESQRQFWIEEEYIIKGKVYKILVEAKKRGGSVGGCEIPILGFPSTVFSSPASWIPSGFCIMLRAWPLQQCLGSSDLVWPPWLPKPAGVIARNTSLLHKWALLNFGKLVCYSSFKNVIINEPSRLRMGQPTHLLQLKHVIH